MTDADADKIMYPSQSSLVKLMESTIKCPSRNCFDIPRDVREYLTDPHVDYDDYTKRRLIEIIDKFINDDV